ncbi:MAG: YlbL family protein [Sporichthyaceae bacterium]
MFSKVDWRAPRTIALTVAGGLLALLAGMLIVLPVPYARIAPGPATDTLGAVDGKTLIVIEGRESFPVTGKLELTTVSITNPDHRMSLIEALTGWFREGVAIVPKDTIYDKNKSAEEIKEENVVAMATSQQHATAAALKALNIPIKTYVQVEQLTEGKPAYDRLKLEDRILEVDGTAVGKPEEVVEAVRKRKPGEEVVFKISRGGRESTETITTVPNPDKPSVPLVGLVPGVGYEFPFKVKIELDNVGGPSAGMMFALGIIERLTPEAITGGRIVAGTGSIDDDGAIGKIGGIVMKIRGAKKSGATVFLVPAENCREAAQGAPKGIELVKVDKLTTALSALEAIRTGKGSFPRCSDA